MLALQPRIGHMAPGSSSSRDRSPLRLIPWAYFYSSRSPRAQAKGYADGAAIATGWPDEIGAADMTVDAAGPVWRTSQSGLGIGGNRACVETTATHILRTAAAALSLTTTYSVFVCAQLPAGGLGVMCGGQTAASACAYPVAIFNWNLGAGAALASGTAQDTLYHRFTSVITSGNDTLYMDGVSIVTGTAGNTTPTRAAVGGYADVGSPVPTRAVIIGFYQGDLTAHPNYPELLAVAQ